MNNRYENLIKFIVLDFTFKAIIYFILKYFLIKPLGEAAEKARKEREAQKIDLDIPAFMKKKYTKEELGIK